MRYYLALTVCILLTAQSLVQAQPQAAASSEPTNTQKVAAPKTPTSPEKAMSPGTAAAPAQTTSGPTHAANPTRPGTAESIKEGDESAKTTPEASDLTLQRPPNGRNVTLDSFLRIKATGKYVDAMKAVGPERLTLFLDDVAMPGLKLSFAQRPDEKSLLVNIFLARDSESEPNRKAWDTLLNTHLHKPMTLSAALAIGNEPPVYARPDFTFEIASKTRISLVATACLLVFVLALGWFISSTSILRDSPAGPYSLGKAQMAVWGLIVALSFLGLWLVTGSMERIPPQVLTLLGISAATGLGSVVIGRNDNKRTGTERTIGVLNTELAVLNNTKTAELGNPKSGESILKAKLERDLARLPQHLTRSWKNFLYDICNDGNGISFQRLQVVIWTVILVSVFVVRVTRIMTMPEFSETLLVLMGISSGTYLGFKFSEKPQD